MARGDRGSSKQSLMSTIAPADANHMVSSTATAIASDTSDTETIPAEDALDTKHHRVGSSRNTIIAVVVYFWVRVALIVSTPAFETPDTESYRSGQATRPPISSALLSLLGDRPYVVLSALVSTAGFAALVWALWDARHLRRSYAMAIVVVGVSLFPMVTVYEHWLVPDSLIVGMALLALSLAWRRIDARWYPWTLGVLCVLITCTKEVGFGVVVLVTMVMMVRRSYRLAGASFVICAVLFATVVLPASDRTGQVLWHQPADTELTMERFRVVVGGLIWSDLSPELAEVGERSAECGMTMNQLVAETFVLTDRIVSFRNCPELWDVVDNLSQVDVLAAHIENPKYVGRAIERGFTPDMNAMALWSDYSFTQQPLLSIDRIVAGLVALLPLLALGVSLVLRRGRLVALIAVTATSMALVAALVDPTGQDRHAIVFRVCAFALGLMAVAEMSANAVADTDDHDDSLAATA